MNREGKLILLSSLFVGALLVANFIAVKLVAVGPFLVPAGIIAYPLTFLFTDTIAEVYGKDTARRVVWTGFGVNLVAVALVVAALRLLPAPFPAPAANTMRARRTMRCSVVPLRTHDSSSLRSSSVSIIGVAILDMSRVYHITVNIATEYYLIAIYLNRGRCWQ